MPWLHSSYRHERSLPDLPSWLSSPLISASTCGVVGHGMHGADTFSLQAQHLGSKFRPSSHVHSHPLRLPGTRGPAPQPQPLPQPTSFSPLPPPPPHDPPPLTCDPASSTSSTWHVTCTPPAVMYRPCTIRHTRTGQSRVNMPRHPSLSLIPCSHSLLVLVLLLLLPCACPSSSS